MGAKNTIKCYDICKKGEETMAFQRRYELTDEEWNRVKDLLPTEKTGRKGRPPTPNRPMLNAMIWLARSGAPWRDLPERFPPWESVYSRFRKWIDDGILDNIFRIFALEAELGELSIDGSIVRAHQHSAGVKKNEIGRSRGGLSTKFHFIVDAYGYPVYFILSEGQESDSKYAIPVLSQVNIEGSDVLGDKGYDADKIIDYIYESGGEPTIPSKANRIIQRQNDWWLYKERHKVECFFQKLKNYRRIATRYDKHAFTFAGFIGIACICIWMDCTVKKSMGVKNKVA